MSRQRSATPTPERTPPPTTALAAPVAARPLVRAVPCLRYLKYLFAQGKSVEQVEQQAFDLGLLYGGEGYLTDLLLSLNFPQPFRPNQPGHPATQGWLEKHGIAVLFPAPGPGELREALQLIQKPRAKEIIETLVVAGATRATIKLCLEREKIETSEKVLLWVERVFWDIGAMDSTELKAQLLSRTPNPGQQEAFPFLSDKYKKASYSDPRLILSHMPRGPAAVMLAQARLGMPMSRVDLAKLYEMLETLMVTKAFEVATSPNKESMIDLAALMSAAKASADLREKCTKPAASAAETMRSAVIKYRQTGVYDVNALTAGNHRASPYTHGGDQPRDDRDTDGDDSGAQGGGAPDQQAVQVVRSPARPEKVG